MIKNTREKEASNLTISDIKKLLTYTSKKGTTKLSARITRRNIDIWLFQFSIGGQDYVDIANLNWEYINNGRVKFKRFKNRNKPEGGELVDNMLCEFALNIIEKYGDKKSNRIFSFIPEPNNERKYGAFRRLVGKSLERVTTTLGLPDKIRTKTTRYLFRSFSGELLIDALVIMQLQGHKPEGITYQYQRRLPYDVIDKEHNKVLDLIFKEDIINP